MPKQPSIYRPVAGRRRTLFGFSQLWLAQDHLLLVRSSRFVEHYQRFALSDIQSIVISGTGDSTPVQVGTAGAAILWTLLALAVASLFAKIFLAATGAVAIVFVILDVVRGPRCRCYLNTAVSRVLLKPLYRMNTAQGFLAEIRPAIEAVQGSLAEGTVLAPEGPIDIRPSDAPPEVPRRPGYLPEILFGLFLLDAMLILLDQRFPRVQLSNALLTTIFSEFALIVFCLIRRAGRDPRRVVYGLMAAALFLIGWDAFAAGSSFISIVADAARRGGNFAFTTSFNLWDHNRALIAAAWRVAAGAAGLLASYMER